MARNSFTFRIGAEGLDTLRRELEAVGPAGKKALDAITASVPGLTAGLNAAQASIQATTEKARASLEKLKLRESATAAQQDFSSFIGVRDPVPGAAASSAAVFEEAALAAETEERAIKQLALQARDLVEQHDQMAAASRRFMEAEVLANGALEKGVITAAQYRAALAGEKAALDAVAAAAQRAAKANSVFNLSHGAQASLRAAGINFVQGVSSGISPMQMAMTEATQVAGAFLQDGKIGIATLLGLGGAAAAAAGSIALLTIAYEQGAAEGREFSRMQQLTGNAAGLTAASLNRITAAAAQAGNVGLGAARDIAMGMAATGKLSGDVIDRLARATGDYAAATKQSAEDAGADLAKLFSDPKRGMDELDDAYNFIDIAERKRIRTLIETGQITQAQIALFDAFKPRIEGQADNIGLLERAWQGAAEAAGYYWDLAKGIGRESTIEDQIAKLQSGIADLSLLPGAANAPGMKEMSDKLKSLQRAKEVLDQRAALDSEVGRLQGLGKEFDDQNQSQQTFALRQKAITEEMQKATIAIADYDKALIGLAMTAETSPEKDKTVSGLKAAEEAARIALAQAQHDMAVLRHPVIAAQDQLRIAQSVAGAAPSNRASTEAYLAELDRAGHSSNVDEFMNREALAQAAATKARLAQTTAIRDQNTEMEMNIRLALDAATAWERSAAEGAVADANRSAVIAQWKTGAESARTTAQAMRLTAVESLETGAKQLQQLRDQAMASEMLADAAKLGPRAEKEAQINIEIAERTKEMRAQLEIMERMAAKGDGSGADPKVMNGLRRVISETESSVRQISGYNDEIDLSRSLVQQQQQQEAIRNETAAVHLNASARAVTLAQMQAELDLRNRTTPATKADSDAYIANAKAIAVANIHLQEQQAIADELPQFFDQAFDRIGNSITEAFAQGEISAVKMKDVARAAIFEVEREMLKLAALNPLKNALFGSNLPTLSSVANFAVGGGSAAPGSGGAAGSYVGPGAAVAVTQGQNVAASGGMGGGIFSSLLASGSLFSGPGQGLGSMIFGAPGGAVTGLHQATPPTAGLFGAYGSGWTGGVSDFLNTGAGAGLFGGLLGFGSSLLSGQDLLPSAITGGLTGIGTAVAGPVGGIAGGFLGSIIGSLFGKKKKTKTTKKVSSADLAFTDGYLGIADDGQTKAGALADSAVPDINDILASAGATIDDGLSGWITDVYKKKTKGGKVKSEEAYQQLWFGDQFLGRPDSPDQIAAMFASGALGVAADQGKVTGVSQSVLDIFKNSWRDTGAGMKEKEDVDAAIAFGKFFDRVDQIRTPAQAASEAMAQLTASMAKARGEAAGYGLEVEKIDAIFRENFLDDIKDQILGLKDPTALALKKLDLEKAGVLAQAEKLGAGLAEVEELYGLKRQAIVDQGLEGVNSSFRDFFASLTQGSESALSPEDQVAQARGRYADVVGAIDAGGDSAEFVKAAQDLLQVLGNYYAHGPDYAAAFADVLQRTREYGDIPGFVDGGWHSGGPRWVGEDGRPELEVTGPSRILPLDQIGNMLAARGRNGDTQIAHVNEAEIRALKAMGGSGTINPQTGLLEFAGGGSGAFGSSVEAPGDGWAGLARPSDVKRAIAVRGREGNVIPLRAPWDDLDPEAAKPVARMLSGKGRNGDTELAHLNRAEMDLLLLSGGSGTINPFTGMREFGGGGGAINGKGGSGLGGHTGAGMNDSRRDGGKKNQADSEAQADRRNIGKAQVQGMKKVGNATVADKMVIEKYKANPKEGIETDKDFWDAVGNLGDRYNDYNDTDHGFWDGVGNFIAGLLGFHEIDPSKQPLGASMASSRADWGFDPIGGIVGLAGLGMGLPGLGILAGQLSNLAGNPLDINLGPDVFGGALPEGETSTSLANKVAGGMSPGALGGGLSPEMADYADRQRASEQVQAAAMASGMRSVMSAPAPSNAGRSTDAMSGMDKSLERMSADLARSVDSGDRQAAGIDSMHKEIVGMRADLADVKRGLANNSVPRLYGENRR